MGVLCIPIRDYFDPFWGHFRAIWGHFRAIWGQARAIGGTFSATLGTLKEVLGPIWAEKENKRVFLKQYRFSLGADLAKIAKT